MSAGMAYEAMNNAGALHSRLIVILNDNDMSIAPPVGAMSAYLARLVLGRAPTSSLRDIGKQLAEQAARSASTSSRHARRGIRARLLSPAARCSRSSASTMSGPIDGHNLDHLLPVLKNVRDAETGPILVHVVTQKGKGYAPAEASADKYHGVNKFDVVTGAQAKPKANAPAYTKVFGESLIKEARKDDKIVAITAAMPSGTGSTCSARNFPTRTFDVGIAEQHAVTFAAGLATEGYKPFCAIYSTFLQRAYDQVVHDVAIQNLPVRFAHRPRGPRRRRRPDPCRARSTSPISAACRTWSSWRPPTRPNWSTWSRPPAAHRRPARSRFRYPRGEGVGVDMPRGRRAAGDRQGPHRARGHARRAAVARHAARRSLKAADELEAPGFRPRSPMRASPSRSTTIWSCGSRASTRC